MSKEKLNQGVVSLNSLILLAALTILASIDIAQTGMLPTVTQPMAASECIGSCHRTFVIGCTMYFEEALGTGLPQLYKLTRTGQGFAVTPIGPRSPIYKYNGLGYRQQDSKLYAIEQTDKGGKNLIFRINPNTGAIENLGQPLGLSGGEWTAGTIDGNGNLVVSGTGQVITVIDITVNPPKIISSKAMTPGRNYLADLAYNRTDGKIYGYELNKQKLVTVNPATGLVTSVGLYQGGLTYSTTVGSAFFDLDSNKMYLFGGKIITPGEFGGLQDRFYQIGLGDGKITELNIWSNAGLPYKPDNTDATSCF